MIKPLVFFGWFFIAVASVGRIAAREPAQKKLEPKAAKITFTRDIVPLLSKYCTACHGGKKPKGDMALDKITDDFEALKHPDIWDKVGQNLRAGNMPPEGRTRPTAAEMDKILKWADTAAVKIDCTKARDPGRVTLRRLNKAEYQNTIRDLVGIDFKPAEDFPADDVGYGFDNIGDLLTLSPLLLEKYLDAADKIVTEVFKNPDIRQRILKKPPPKTPPEKKGQFLRETIEHFAGRAYRRPLTDDEFQRLRRFLELARDQGQGFEVGVQLVFKAILVSPHFLFRVELDYDQRPGAVYHINEWELASRLSFFLWSSMPDDQLFALARSKSLRQGDVLDKQVRRMLADPKGRALTDNFAGQWLQLRRFLAATPDPGIYPKFNQELRRAMLRETEMFFENLIKEDRSILDFIDADYSFINETLAKHYGMAQIKGKDFRKVKLPPERGGVLTHGSILTLTSNPTRTSPVNRGVYILDNILGTPPPPPPPDVPELPAAGAELKGTLRQRMEQHRTNALCASCHQRMDPLGFAFENFDGIGAFRTREGKFPIDSSGTLPGGQNFKGPKELRQILKTTRAGDFRRCFTEKMLTYALGRGLEPYDKCAVDDISAAVSRNQDCFSSVVLAIVNSEPFQKRKAKGEKK